MATSLSGLFDGYVDPQQLREKQQQQFSQNLSQAVTPQAFIAQVGSNMGQQLGNFIPGMMGQKSYNEKVMAILKQVQGIEDPVEQARAAYQAFSQAGMAKEAQMMLDRLQEAKTQAIKNKRETSTYEYTDWKQQKEREKIAKEESTYKTNVDALTKLHPDWPQSRIEAVANDPVAVRQILGDQAASTPTGKVDIVAYEMYQKPFNQLTPAEKQAVAMKANAPAAEKAQKATAQDRKEYAKARSQATYNTSGIKQAQQFVKYIDEGAAKYGGIENLASSWRTLMGNTTEGDRIKGDIRRFVTSSVNAVLNMAKGPQTDQDAQRARDQIINGLDKNDGKLMRDGLVELQRVMRDAASSDIETMGFLEDQFSSFGNSSSKYSLPEIDTPSYTSTQPAATSAAGKSPLQQFWKK